MVSICFEEITRSKGTAQFDKKRRGIMNGLLKKYMKKDRFLYFFGVILEISGALLSHIWPVAAAGKIVDVGIIQNNHPEMIKLFVLSIILFIIGRLMAYFGVIIIDSKSFDMCGKLGMDMTKKIFYLDNNYFKNTTIGEMNTLLTKDIQNIKKFISYDIKQFTHEILISIITLIYCMTINPTMAIALLAFIPIFLLITFIYDKKTEELYNIEREKTSNLNSYIQENIEGNRLIKNLGTEEKEIKKFKSLNEDYVSYKIKINYKIYNYMEVLRLLGYIMWIVMILLGGIFIVKGNLTIGGFMIFYGFIDRILTPMYGLIDYMNDFQYFKISIKRIKDLFKYEPKQKDDGTLKLDDINKIKFRSVSFIVDDKEVLSDINFEMEKNKTYAFIGEVGSGKSTIANLICRFYDIDKGAIKIDGVNIKEIKLKSLRSQITVMQQENYLFSNTIMENLKYGDDNLTDEDVINACKKMNIDNWINKFPKGYNTILNGNESNLSDGERQIICYARTIINNPKILIFDEATSRMDTKTEKVLQDLTQEMIKDKTLIVIAHRLSTIVNCDKIFFLKDKRIVEVGNHTELMERKGEYYNLYLSQMI